MGLSFSTSVGQRYSKCCEDNPTEPNLWKQPPWSALGAAAVGARPR